MNQSTDAPTAPACSDSKVPDAVMRYHESIRRTLVDFGDDIIDHIATAFPDNPKILAQLEDVRRDMIDPLRVTQ